MSRLAGPYRRPWLAGTALLGAGLPTLTLDYAVGLPLWVAAGVATVVTCCAYRVAAAVYAAGRADERAAP